MKAQYLIQLIEDYCKEKNLNITELYEEIARRYQQIWGINIDLEMREHEQTDMAYYLESRGIVERYVEILNVIKKKLINT